MGIAFSFHEGISIYKYIYLFVKRSFKWCGHVIIKFLVTTETDYFCLFLNTGNSRQTFISGDPVGVIVLKLSLMSVSVRVVWCELSAA